MMITASQPPARRRRYRAFTLIEIMIVVAIIGLFAAMGLPAIIKALQKDGMRKAISDITDVCSSARAKAIFSGQQVVVEFFPGKRTFDVAGGGAGKGSVYVSSSTLPAGVEFAMLDINLMDFSASDWCRARFFPDGTSDEMTVIFHAKDQWRKVTLEFSTGLPTVTDDVAK